LPDLIREPALQSAEELIREIMNSCENDNKTTQIKVYQADEQINKTTKLESCLREGNEDSFKNN